MSVAAPSYREQVQFLVTNILESVPSLMTEAFYLAALPLWSPVSLFSTLRQKEDGRDQGLIDRLEAYSFIVRTDTLQAAAEPGLAVEQSQRRVILVHWIENNPGAFRDAHRRCLAYWEQNPDPNTFAQTQTLIYHRFFVDPESALLDLVKRFRVYSDARLFAAADRLLDTAGEALELIALLPPDDQDSFPPGLDRLLLALDIRLDQLRGRWDDRRDELRLLRRDSDLPDELLPFVARVNGEALLNDRLYADAIAEFELAGTQLEKLTAHPLIRANYSRERVAVQIALGDAYLAFAESLRTPVRPALSAANFWQKAHRLVQFIVSLPLILYLSLLLGRRVWRAQMGQALFGMDWIVARLYASAIRHYRRAEENLGSDALAADSSPLTTKLATVYLALGDAETAYDLLESLEQKIGSVSRGYRTTVLQLRLGEAEVLLKRPEAAIKRFNFAIPSLEQYEDHDLALWTRRQLAEALWEVGEVDAALDIFETIVATLQESNDWEAATSVVERLALLRPQRDLPDELETRVDSLYNALSRRQYAVTYRHPIWRLAGIVLGVLLVIILFSLPLLAIQLDPAYELTPQMTFVIEPEFGGSGFGAPNLNDVDLQTPVQEMTVEVPRGETLIWVGFIAVGAYTLFSLLLGLVLIAGTPLWLIERYVGRLRIQIDDQEISVGSGGDQRTLPLNEIETLLSANMGIRAESIANFSSFALVTPRARASVNGNANWYHGLWRYVTEKRQQSAQIVDMDHWMLRDVKFWVYLLGLFLFALLTAAVYRQMDLLGQFILGTPYRLLDLYPYLFLILLPAPIYWFLLRPLQVDSFQDPYSRRAWWLLGLGAILLVLQLVTGFRPLLTGVNLVLPLLTLFLLVLPLIFLYQARDGAERVYGRRTRLFTAMAVVPVAMVMLTLSWLEFRAHYALAVGNRLHQELVIAIIGCNERTEEAGAALAAYDRAIAPHPIPGLDYARAVTQTRFGVAPDAFTPMLALQNKAALLARLGCHQEALALYQQLDGVTSRPEQLYVQMGIVGLAAAGVTEAAMDAGGSPSATKVELQSSDWFSRAIDHDPDRSELYLWRGFAYQAEGALDKAECDYHVAWGGTSETMPDGCPNPISAELEPLTSEQQVQAQNALGWIAFDRKEYTAADTFFQAALSNRTNSVLPRIGFGYVHYQQGNYSQAIVEATKVLSQEAGANRTAALVLASSAHWKLGGLTVGDERCDNYESALAYLDESITAEGQTDEKLAFWYRTRGNLLWLLQSQKRTSGERCRPNRVETLDESVASYTKALELTPDDADYLHMRARLRYARWYLAGRDARLAGSPERWAVPIRDDIVRALNVRPNDAGNYEPNRFASTYIVVTMFGDARAALAVDPEIARELYTIGVEVAREVSGGSIPLAKAVAGLEEFLESNPSELDPEFMVELWNLLSPARSLFRQAAEALKGGDFDSAESLYRQGLEMTITRKDITPAANALLAAVVSSGGSPPLNVEMAFREAWPRLAQAADDESMTMPAFKIALIAVALESFDEAGRWFNEGVRRSFLAGDESYRKILREDLGRMWEARESTAQEIIQAIGSDIPDHLGRHPDLEEEGYFWRQHGWFQYDIGKTAFLVGDADGARLALDAAIPDGERAEALGATRGSTPIETFLKEGAWGLYHMLRAEEFERKGELEAALADYRGAVEAYDPVSESVRRREAQVKVDELTAQLGR